jgi:hypothetical protein
VSAPTPEERAARFFAETPEPDGSVEEIVAETMREQAERMAGAPVNEWPPTAPAPGTPATTEADLRGRLDQLWGWAKAGKNGGMYAMDVELVDRFTDDVLRMVRDSVAARDAAAYARGRDEGRAEAARDRLPYLAREVVAGLNAENARLRAEVAAAEWRGANALAALRELVRLKDGPRDEAYELDKPEAWDAARAAAVVEP